MITCTGCGRELPATTEFFTPHKSCRNGLEPRCRECKLAAGARWRENNREKHRAYSREWNRRNPERAQAKLRAWCRKARLDVLRAYGGETPACACCDESLEPFLVIDHIDGGGTAERKSRGAGARFYAWLRSEGYPPGYRVLCHNCNAASSLYGECPHVSSRS